MDLRKYRDFLNKRKVRLEILRESIAKFEAEQVELSAHLGNLEKAREIVGRVGILAQREVKVVIERLVSQALQAVFGPEYSFEVVDQIQRNKPETNFYVNISGRPHLLKGELGGGVVDLTSFCLRVVLWAITSPRTENTIILDEPLRFVDKQRLEKAGEMIKRLSEMLNLQFICVTHEEQLIDAADSAYHVAKSRGVSTVGKVL